MVVEESFNPRANEDDENLETSQIPSQTASVTTGSSTTILNFSQGKQNSQGTAIAQQVPLNEKQIHQAQVTSQMHSSLTPDTLVNQPEGQGREPVQAINNSAKESPKPGFGITPQVQKHSDTLPTSLSTADIHPWQKKHQAYAAAQHLQYLSTSSGAAPNATTGQPDMQPIASPGGTDPASKGRQHTTTSAWKQQNTFAAAPYVQSSPNMALPMSPAPPQRYPRQQFLHTTPQTPPERLWEMSGRPIHNSASQPNQTMNSPPPLPFVREAETTQMTAGIPPKVTDTSDSQHETSVRGIQIHQQSGALSESPVHATAAPNPLTKLSLQQSHNQGALGANSGVRQNTTNAISTFKENRLKDGVANSSYQRNQIAHIPVSAIATKVAPRGAQSPLQPVEQRQHTSASPPSNSESASVGGHRAARPNYDMEMKKNSSGAGQFDDAEEDACLSRGISPKNSIVMDGKNAGVTRMKVGEKPTVNITGAIPMPGFDVSKARGHHPNFPFVPWQVREMQYMISQGQMIAGNEQSANIASHRQPIQRVISNKEQHAAGAAAQSIIGNSKQSNDQLLSPVSPAWQVQTQQAGTKKKREKKEENGDKADQKKKRQKKAQNREPPTEIAFSVKDWEHAYTTLSGFDDLTSILSDQDCRFLGRNFWIFSIQQLDWVLSGKSDESSVIEQETTRQSILKLLIVKVRPSKVKQNAKTGELPNFKTFKDVKQATSKNTSVSTEDATDGLQTTVNATNKKGNLFSTKLNNSEHDNFSLTDSIEHSQSVVDANLNKRSISTDQTLDSKTELLVFPKDKEGKLSLETDAVNQVEGNSASLSKDVSCTSPSEGQVNAVAVATESKPQSLGNTFNESSGTEEFQIEAMETVGTKGEIGNKVIADACLQKYICSKPQNKDKAMKDVEALVDKQYVVITGNNVTGKKIPEEKSTILSTEIAKENAARLASSTSLVAPVEKKNSSSQSDGLNDEQEGKGAPKDCDGGLKRTDSSMDSEVWAEEKIHMWESAILQWKGVEKTRVKVHKASEKKQDRSDFCLQGPLSCLVPIGSRNFLASMSIKHAFKFLSTKKTEASPLIWTFGKWREKCGFTPLKSAALARHMIGLAVRIEKAITLLPPADEYTRTWLGGPLSVLTGGAKDFLIDECGLRYGEDLLGARTKDLADRLVAWREAKNLAPLKGSGKVAMVSGWKASIKEAKEASSGVGKLLKESDLLCEKTAITEESKTPVGMLPAPTAKADKNERDFDSPNFLSDYLKKNNANFLQSQGITTARQLLDANKSRSSDLIKAFVTYRHAKGSGSTELSSCAKVINDWTHKIENLLKNEDSSRKRPREEEMEDTQKEIAKEANPDATESTNASPIAMVNPGSGPLPKVKSNDIVQPGQDPTKKSVPRKAVFLCEEDSIESLSKTTRSFLATQGIQTGEQFLNTKTSVLAAKFIEWRELQDMTALKGYGAIASVSAWKGTVRKAAADNGWCHILDKTPKPTRGKQPDIEAKSDADSPIVVKKASQTKTKKEPRGKRSISPKGSERVSAPRKSRPAKTEPLYHPEVLYGQHARSFSVSNRNGDLYDFELTIRKPNSSCKSSNLFPPNVSVYLQYIGSRSCKLTGIDSVSPEEKVQLDPYTMPILTDAKLLQDDKRSISDFDGTSCDSFSSRLEGSGLIDLVCYGIFPSFGNDRINSLKADIEEFIRAPSSKKGEILPIEEGLVSSTETSKTQDMLNDRQCDSTQTRHNDNGNAAAFSGPYAANVFAQKDDEGKFHSLLYLDQPMERGQTVELIMDRQIREIDQENTHRNEAYVRMNLKDRLSLLSKEDLMDITDDLSSTIGDSLLYGVSQVVNPPHDYNEKDVEGLERLFIARRRLHWVADQIKQQHKKLDELQRDGRAPTKKARRRNLIALYWKSELCRDLSVIPGGQGPDVNKLLRKEVGKEVLLSMSTSGILKHPFRVDLWCGMSSGLLRKSVKRISTYLLKDLPATEESQKILLKSLTGLITSAANSIISPKKNFKDFAFPEENSNVTLTDIDIYRDAMSLCGEHAFVATIAGRPVLLNHALVAAKSPKQFEVENLLVEMTSVTNVIKGDKMFNYQWYVEKQIIPIVDAIVEAGIVEWIVPKGAIDSSSYPRAELLEAISVAFGSSDEKVDCPSLDDKDLSFSVPKLTERVKVKGLSTTNPPIAVPYATNSRQLFLGIVWPLLNGVYGWKLDAGEYPNDVVFLMPGGKNRSNFYSQIGKAQKERRRKRAKRLVQMKEISLDNLTKGVKGTFVELLERDLKREESMDETSSDYEVLPSSSSQIIVLTSKVLEDFFKMVLESLPPSDNTATLGHDRLRNVVDSILACFKSLAPRLLYPLEVPSGSNENSLERLGCDVLLRFLILLPRLLRESGLSPNQLDDTMAVSKELTHFLSSRLQLYFDEGAHPPEEEYMDKIVGPNPYIAPKVEHTVAVANDIAKKSEEYQNQTDKRESASYINREIVRPEDRQYVTDFTGMVMSQVVPYRATNDDVARKGRRLVKLGAFGLVCRHCWGTSGEGKYFFSSLDSLGTAAAVVHNHMVKCPNFSSELRTQLIEFKSKHVEQRKKLPFGAQAAFFGRVWSRIHHQSNKSRSNSPMPSLSLSNTTLEAGGASEKKNNNANKNNENHEDGNKNKGFKCHIALLEFLRDTPEWSVQEDLMEAVKDYYKWLEHGGKIYNTEFMPSHCNSEWLLAKAAKEKEQEEGRPSRGSPSKIWISS